MAESPSALLERAAQRLLELSGDPLGEPQKWWLNVRPAAWGQHTDWEICGRGKPLFVALYDATESDMEWVTVMSPAVAGLLVEWLRGSVDHPPPVALDFARAILGEHTEVTS